MSNDLPSFENLADKYDAIARGRQLLIALANQGKISVGFLQLRMFDLEAMEQDIEAAEDANDLTAAVTPALSPEQEAGLSGALDQLAHFNLGVAAAEGMVAEIFNLLEIVRG